MNILRKGLFFCVTFINCICIGCSLNNTKMQYHKVSYESKYGELPTAFEVEDGYILSNKDLPVLQEKNYDFLGWFVDDLQIDLKNMK